jgi:hypothetical protein
MGIVLSVEGRRICVLKDQYQPEVKTGYLLLSMLYPSSIYAF